MTLSWIPPLLALSAGIILYAVLLRRLAEIAHPVRLQLAESAGKFVADDANPKSDKAVVMWLMLNSFSFWPMVWTAILMPIYFIRRLTKRTGPEPEPNEDMKQILKWGIFSIYAANPAFGTIALIEGMVFGFLLMLFRGLPWLLAMPADAVRMESKGFFKDIHLHAASHHSG